MSVDIFVADFSIGKGGDEVSKACIRAIEWLGEDVDRTCLAVEESFHGGWEKRAEAGVGEVI